MQQLRQAEELTATRPGRLRTGWRAAHEPVAGVSRRVQLIAYAVPLAVLPSSVWRLPILFDDGVGVGERAYVVALSVVSEAFAFTAIGLIARWGEVFPRWVPFLRGRRVPPKAVVIPAAAAATVLTLLFTLLFIASEISGTTIRGDEVPADFPSQAGGWEAAWFYFCYSPLALWGPMLAVLTVAYAKRRRVAAKTPAAA
ncbi:hypothetical protein LHJ74_19640 [Streptomyces sp. N2-109]|uniref:Integral membrane protein n=1 Tax=Streptomyces gossypii TaxID=2883101 RepID=A0ABT2JW17_9ACTN|nr:hypothetical protein [Streptomyces gossypii]MCT2592088.1 hypothetical protein [Streptomyces gossypii]